MFFLEDYHNWIKIADAALPRNIIGYLIQICLEPFRAEPFTLLPYNNPKELRRCGQEDGAKGFIVESLPEREGPRPEISKWVAPSRQVSQFAGEAMHMVCLVLSDESLS